MSYMSTSGLNPPAVLPPSDHFDGKRFHNLVPRRHGLGSVLRWLASRQPGKWHDWTEYPPGPPPPPTSQELRITYINHSTFLLQLDGINVLTDPVWSKRASPLQWLGPRRRRPPGIRYRDLPPINVVVLSHDHYDHMDIATLQRLNHDHNPCIYTGLRNARVLSRNGIGNVIELDWWEGVTHGDLRITAVPAQHFSGRSPFDRDRTLWCGFVLRGPSAQVYFAGDTGMGPHFQQIVNRYPELDVSILPIGAFRPEWFMGEVHLAPPEAVEVHLLLSAPVSLACHFGVFPLADDGESEPVELLQQTLANSELRGTEFKVLKLGEGQNFTRKSKPSPETTELRR